MAAGEDEPEAIVEDLVGIVVRRLVGAGRLGGGVGVQLLIEPRPAPDPIDGLVAGRLDDPGAGKLGHAGGRPLVDRHREGLLGGFFGHVEIADESDQGGDDPAPVGPVDCVDGGAGPERIVHGR